MRDPTTNPNSSFTYKKAEKKKNLKKKVVDFFDKPAARASSPQRANVEGLSDLALQVGENFHWLDHENWGFQEAGWILEGGGRNPELEMVMRHYPAFWRFFRSAKISM